MPNQKKSMAELNRLSPSEFKATKKIPGATTMMQLR